MCGVYKALTRGRDLNWPIISSASAQSRLFIQNKMDGLFMSGAIKNGGEKFSPG